MTPTPAETRAAPQPYRLLGAYLFGLCVYQIGIYCWPGGPPFILDPRAGIPVLLINHFSFDNKIIYPVEWITATWLVIAAAVIFFRGRLLMEYLIAEIAVMGPEGAVNIVYKREIERAPEADRERLRAEKIAEFRERFANPYVAAERGYIDAVIEPSRTRAKLITALRSLETKRDTNPKKKHGNIPL